MVNMFNNKRPITSWRSHIHNKFECFHICTSQNTVITISEKHTVFVAIHFRTDKRTRSLCCNLTAPRNKRTYHTASSSSHITRRLDSNCSRRHALACSHHRYLEIVAMVKTSSKLTQQQPKSRFCTRSFSSGQHMR